MAEGSEIGICLILLLVLLLLLCSGVGSQPTSAAIFVPNWVAGMADQKQYVLRTPREQHTINVTSVCSQWKTAFVFNCLILVSVKLASGRAIGLISFMTINSHRIRKTAAAAAAAATSKRRDFSV